MKNANTVVTLLISKDEVQAAEINDINQCSRNKKKKLSKDSLFMLRKVNEKSTRCCECFW